MKALTALACIPLELQANNSYFIESFMAYNSHVMHQLAWNCACIYIYK